MSAIFTPSSRMTNKQYVIAPHAILTIDNTSTTILTLLNTTTSIKRIPQGTTLGQIKNHEDNTCCYVRHNSCSIQPQHTTSITTPNPILSKSKSYSSIHSTMHELTSHLPRQQQDQILSILVKHKSVFDTSKTSIMNTNNISHRIPILPQHQPIQSYPYHSDGSYKTFSRLEIAATLIMYKVKHKISANAIDDICSFLRLLGLQQCPPKD
ncbi:unnamed protein product, partial [Didymodactylos carnosus]